ncbi:4-hydroxythreonine-4-phosphate dehydrogenase PdxA [Agriterribacter sp.]|uniref:4-hydroxythreonine-4-phosphate dehydrogenase PdxA n=1 Tax=Agriterribacter sp. TaxID=2821509 RepID=UPI002BDC06F4|nr:4-hydroxythreonine-4-phosphate dehydrogenase PdxA [Agriterribacter sp.]HRO45640.1 4-hydroxythreonine-4-phosphate dehydrogenase PdxA [Agriterribacter sp.]HRQ17461.1 4-hydroxythreonine-4-phosphate dehydrogenase PdxA [Agriterribacter sp.]
MKNNKPAIGITMGDPAGVGPEIAVKSLNSTAVFDQCNPLVIGDAKVIRSCIEDLNLALQVNPVHDVRDACFQPGTIDVYDLNNVDATKLKPGEVSAMAGHAAFEAVTTAIQLALDNKIDATVTGPIHKKAINEAGHHFSGHTEIYAHYTGVRQYAMLLVDGDFRVAHISTHVSLRKACDLVKKQRILDVIKLLDAGLNQMGIRNGKIGVAGLNPHAGDAGLFGDEEEKEIIPAIEAAVKLGFRVEGPVAPDTMFTKAVTGYYDGCIAMYHDQGHIPFKLAGFKWNNDSQKMESVKGVNITLGLPIIRTSVDHGTAFDIVGKDLASPDAMLLAIDYAIKLASNKKEQ